LLEGIGAIKPDKKRNHDAYQDSVTSPLSQQHDKEIAAQKYLPEDGEDSNTLDNLHVVLSAIKKVVMFIVPYPNQSLTHNLSL